jgi:sodium transport system ATP-binding protein
VIEAMGLSKTFVVKKKWRKERIEAAQDVSFTCRPGEIYGLLGANGAGKTTTLRMLATILEPTAGTAKVAGFDIVRQAHEVRRHVGFLSTQTALYGRLTAREFVQYFGRLHEVPAGELLRRIDEVFERLDMNDFRDRRCDKLSTGQKQKTSIARTLIHDPPVMIFDEPTIGLDVLAQRTILDFVRQCRDDGRGREALRSRGHHPQRSHHCRGCAGRAEGDPWYGRSRRPVHPPDQRQRRGGMNAKNVLLVYGKEMRDTLRDRRTIIWSIAFPVVVIPLMMVGMIGVGAKVVGKAVAETVSVVLVGADASPELARRIQAVERFDFVDVPDDLEAAIGDKAVRAAIEIPDGFDEVLADGGQPEVLVRYHEGDFKSEAASRDMSRIAMDYRQELLTERSPSSGRTSPRRSR